MANNFEDRPKISYEDNQQKTKQESPVVEKIKGLTKEVGKSVAIGAGVALAVNLIQNREMIPNMPAEIESVLKATEILIQNASTLAQKLASENISSFLKQLDPRIAADLVAGFGGSIAYLGAKALGKIRNWMDNTPKLSDEITERDIYKSYRRQKKTFKKADKGVSEITGRKATRGLRGLARGEDIEDIPERYWDD